MNRANLSARDEMLPNYDFRGGMRGKHHRAYREGHTVTVHDDNDGIDEALRRRYEVDENVADDEDFFASFAKLSPQ